MVVVLFHYHHFYMTAALDHASIPPVETFPYAGALAPFYGEWASKAVELFWMISGFVFAHVYLPRRATAWQFGVARFARLYPLHFVTLLYVALLQWVSLKQAGHWQIYGNNDLWHFVLQIFMASNWPTFSWGLSFNGPLWSVSLEMLIYCFFFAGLTALRRYPLLVSALLCLLCWGWFFLTFKPIVYISASVFLCGGYFFLGSFLYVLGPHRSLARAAMALLPGLAVSLIGIIYQIEHMTVAGAAVVAISLAATLDRLAPGFGGRLGKIGDISYSLYLVHVPLQMSVLLIADLTLDGTRALADSWVTLPLYCVASVALALAAHHWIERPAGRGLRRRLLRKPRQ